MCVETWPTAATGGTRLSTEVGHIVPLIQTTPKAIEQLSEQF